MFYFSSNDLRNLFKSDNVYRYAAFACLKSTYSAKGSESDSNMALSECIYCLPGYLKIFGGLCIKYKKNLENLHLIFFSEHRLQILKPVTRNFHLMFPIGKLQGGYLLHIF